MHSSNQLWAEEVSRKELVPFHSPLNLTKASFVSFSDFLSILLTISFLIESLLLHAAFFFFVVFGYYRIWNAIMINGTSNRFLV